MSETILEVKNLHSFYKAGRKEKEKKTEILKDVSFSIKDGEVVGLVGESGSGKSTLAKAILGIVKDTDGEIVQHFSDVAMVFQDPYGSLNPARKIGWILQEPLRLKGGFSREEMEQKAFEMLERVGLNKEIANHFPRQLSGGQRQRIGIGVALMQEPKLLIADEPVSALDVTIQTQIMALLKKLQREMNLSILFISHDLRVVYTMCDRVLILKEGQIVEQGDVKDIYEHPQHEYTKQLLKAAGI